MDKIINGTLLIRPSKSLIHRHIIAAALAKNGVSTFTFAPFVLNDDNSATLAAVQDMGLALVRENPGSLDIAGGFAPTIMPKVKCKSSGSTMRFLLPLALAKCHGARFFADKSLFKRPWQTYEEILHKQGIKFFQETNNLMVAGDLQPGEFLLPGNISSQFASGLLFSLPLLDGDSQLVFREELQSRPYMELTIEVLAKHSVHCFWKNNTSLLIQGKQEYKSYHAEVEGDYSHAAFFLVAAALGGDIALCGLNKHSSQGDKMILDLLSDSGAKIRWQNDILYLQKGELKSLNVDMGQIPDLLPPLAILAAHTLGESRFYNAARLRYKESDRLHDLTTELTGLGADIDEGEDFLTIRGVDRLVGGEVSSHGDHRLAMAFGIASCFSRDIISIVGAADVAKSAPEFWQQLDEIKAK